MEELLNYAKKVAFSLYQDPEMGSIAGNALLRATRTHDPSKVTLKAYIRVCVKMEAMDYGRRKSKRREEFHEEPFWEGVQETAPCFEAEIPVSQEDWQLLCEYYIERWPYDVVARRHGVTTYRIRRMLKAAVNRLADALRDSV
jgi:DNA-directed RNA polymerase specialized sigma subunit